MSKENENLNEAENSALNIADVSKSLAPHRCPVCNGNGLVPNGLDRKSTRLNSSHRL